MKYREKQHQIKTEQQPVSVSTTHQGNQSLAVTTIDLVIFGNLFHLPQINASSLFICKLPKSSSLISLHAARLNTRHFAIHALFTKSFLSHKNNDTDTRTPNNVTNALTVRYSPVLYSTTF